MLKRTISTGLALAALGVGITACGGYDEPAASSAADAPTRSSAYASPKAAPADAAPAKVEAPSSAPKVAIGDNTFTPATVKVKVGETVTFKNSGAVAHTATATDGADFDSGTLAPGATFKFKATRAGTISYLCSFHAGMQGTIEVG